MLTVKRHNLPAKPHLVCRADTLVLWNNFLSLFRVTCRLLCRWKWPQCVYKVCLLSWQVGSVPLDLLKEMHQLENVFLTSGCACVCARSCVCVCVTCLWCKGGFWNGALTLWTIFVLRRQSWKANLWAQCFNVLPGVLLLLLQNLAQVKNCLRCVWPDTVYCPYR